jgi:hypothetical protein
MWKANGKTTTLSLFLDSLFPKTEMSKMEERRKWKNVNNEEGRRKYRRLRNELKRATDRAKKEYLEKICNEIIEFQRTGRYDLMYMKTKELGWTENHGIQNIDIEDSHGCAMPLDFLKLLKLLDKNSNFRLV